MPANGLIGSLSGIYDPAQIVCTVQSGTQTSVINGFGENIVTIERTSQQTDSYSGADGQVVKFYTNDRRGTISVELLPTSPSNAIFTSFAKADEQNGGVIFSLTIRDILGNDVITVQQCSIKKMPRVVYRKGVEVRVWDIEGYNITMNVLGQGTLS